MLYLIATPIGNLADITLRAIQTLEKCDYILCEDTRRTRILLDHYQLKKPLKSYHCFNEAKKLAEILDDLKEGKQIGLVSDAGTPCICDPGMRLVQAARKEKIPLTTLPGPSASLAALICSGFNITRFQFVGFLPRKKGQLAKLAQEILDYPGVSICYESPFRLKAALEAFATLDPMRAVFVAREITKKFETFYEGTSRELFDFFKDKTVKGECVIVISSTEDN